MQRAPSEMVAPDPPPQGGGVAERSEAEGVPPHERVRLLQAVTGRPRRSVLVDPALDADEQRRFDHLVARRLAGEPLQYLEGTVPFAGIEIAVDRRALIPRPETEELVEIAAAAVTRPSCIVDLCTGSGNLALALKHRFPEAAVYAVDISADALALAAENARRLDLEIHLLHGDLFAPLPGHVPGSVDLLVANPPYVPAGAELPPVVHDHEPHVALFAGADGLDVIRRIGAGVSAVLSATGVFVVEVGADHATVAAEVFVAGEATVVMDMFGSARFVLGRRSTQLD